MSIADKKSKSSKRHQLCNAKESQVPVSHVPLGGNGDGFFSEEAWADIARKLGFSPRQTQIVKCILAGQGDKEIARRLDVSPRTVHTHLERLRAKLGAENRVDLISRVYAVHNK